MDTDIKILTLNLFLRPPGIHTNTSDYKDLRAQAFVDLFISKYDIVCLQEVFSTMSSRKELIRNRARAKGFLYSYQGPRPNPLHGHFTDSGLMILSKFQIVESDYMIFNKGMGVDRLSAKGALYTKIKVNETFLHVFNTHTQASYGTTEYKKFLKYRQIRREQLKEYKNFIDKKVGTSEDPVVITGDFNVDGLECRKVPKFNSPCQDDYNHLWILMSSQGTDNILDVINSKYGQSLSTFGRIDDKGCPIETILTGSDEVSANECLDYIFLMNYQNIVINYNETNVEPFHVYHMPFTQISDHAGVEVSLKVPKLLV
ncbi:hypothetical protein SteCoe_13231 [Stentor coeruleus]|uniref:sphingomyelin phosphodiesterase n=1 Tax=Stentor coeruleus TaxID=5963 RepID=A0A1R2C930_9CILI|nr:hypothetical protein SteCoe_13231 [Stentor coeruleus]